MKNNEKNCAGWSITVLASKTSVPFGALALCLALTLPATGQDLSGLDLGAAKDYAVVSLGSGASMKINSGPIAGSLLIGQGSTLTTDGGNNGWLTNGGILFYDNTGSVDSSGLQIPPTETLVSEALTLSALNSAVSVSAHASSLTATQTFGVINSAAMINGNGGLNVINIDGINNADLTLSGGASDYFIFNVSGSVATNKTMSLSGGVLSSQVLWNLTGSSGNIFHTAGGNTAVGTFLAVNGGDFQFSSLMLDGALINAGGSIDFVSGSELTNFSSFVIPEPNVAGLAALGLLSFLTYRRRAVN